MPRTGHASTAHRQPRRTRRRPGRTEQEPKREREEQRGEEGGSQRHTEHSARTHQAGRDDLVGSRFTRRLEEYGVEARGEKIVKLRGPFVRC